MSPLLLTIALACQSLDGTTTALALRSGRFVEANSAMNHKALFPMKVSVDVLGIWAYHKASKRKGAAAIPVVLAVSGCAAGTWNTRQMMKGGK